MCLGGAFELEVGGRLLLDAFVSQAEREVHDACEDGQQGDHENRVDDDGDGHWHARIVAVRREPRVRRA
jgi:hypothetical protein